MAKKTIKITCEGSGLAKLDELVPTQGNLKSLSEANYKKLRGRILAKGFRVPVFIWKDKKKKLKLLDGHQRRLTLITMRDQEGYEIPDIPYAEIKAESEKDAREMVLEILAQYGKLERQGLYEFTVESDISVDFIKQNIHFGDSLNIESWAAEFFDQAGGGGDGGEGGGSRELGRDGFGETKSMAVCPKCSHEFEIPK